MSKVIAPKKCAKSISILPRKLLKKIYDKSVTAKCPKIKKLRSKHNWKGSLTWLQ